MKKSKNIFKAAIILAVLFCTNFYSCNRVLYKKKLPSKFIKAKKNIQKQNDVNYKYAIAQFKTENDKITLEAKRKKKNRTEQKEETEQEEEIEQKEERKQKEKIEQEEERKQKQKRKRKRRKKKKQSVNSDEDLLASLTEYALNEIFIFSFQKVIKSLKKQMKKKIKQKITYYEKLNEKNSKVKSCLKNKSSYDLTEKQEKILLLIQFLNKNKNNMTTKSLRDKVNELKLSHRLYSVFKTKEKKINMSKLDGVKNPVKIINKILYVRYS